MTIAQMSPEQFQRQIAQLELVELKKNEEKRKTMEDVSKVLNPQNKEHLNRFKEDLENTRAYKSKDGKTLVFVNYQKNISFKIEMKSQKKANVKRGDALDFIKGQREAREKAKAPAPAQAPKEAPKDIVWTMEKPKPAQKPQEVKLKDTLLAPSTATPSLASQEELRKKFEEGLGKAQQETEKIKQRTKGAYKLAASVLTNQDEAYRYAIEGITYTFSRASEAVKDRIAKHSEGRELNFIPTAFVDSLGQVLNTPLYYVELEEKGKTTHRIIDPKTGGKYDGKSLEEALKNYADKGGLPDGTMMCRFGNYFRAYTVAKSTSKEEQVSRMMGLVGTSSLAAAFVPSPLTQTYSALAGLFTLPYYMKTAAGNILDRIESGTFSMDSATVKDVFTIAAPLTAPIKGTAGLAARLLTSGTAVALTVDTDKIRAIAKSDLSREEKIARISSEVGFSAVMIAMQVRQFTITPQQKAAAQKIATSVQASTEKIFNGWANKCSGKVFESTSIEAKTFSTYAEGNFLKKGAGALNVRGFHNQKTGKITLSVSMAKTAAGTIDEAAMNGTTAHECAHHQPAGQAWYKYDSRLGEGYANAVSEMACKEAKLPCQITSYPMETKKFNAMLGKVRGIGGEKAVAEVLTMGPEAARKYIPNLDELYKGR